MLRKVREHKEATDTGKGGDAANGNQPTARVERAGDTTPQRQVAAQQEPRQPPALNTETGTAPRPKRGPKPDYETAWKVAEIVSRVAGERPWRSKLDGICMALDEENIPRPKTWRKRGYDSWFDALSERSLVGKAISHHLRLTQQSGRTFS
jgi:hypothetical protein